MTVTFILLQIFQRYENFCLYLRPCPVWLCVLNLHYRYSRTFETRFFCLFIIKWISNLMCWVSGMCRCRVTPGNNNFWRKNWVKIVGPTYFCYYNTIYLSYQNILNVPVVMSSIWGSNNSRLLINNTHALTLHCNKQKFLTISLGKWILRKFWGIVTYTQALCTNLSPNLHSWIPQLRRTCIPIKDITW